MFIAYAVLTSLMALTAACVACLSFLRHPIPVEAARQVRVPESWVVPLGALMLAGSFGLLVGFAMPAVGVAAATGLVLYFVGAIIAHLRARDHHLGPPGGILLMATATLVATLLHTGS